MKVLQESNVTVLLNSKLKIVDDSAYFLQRVVTPTENGSEITFTLTTTNAKNGTNVGYSISNLSSSDITSGSLTGSFVVVNNTASVTIRTSLSPNTIGSNSTSLSLNNGASSISVFPVPTYSLSRSASSVNEGSSISFTLTTTGLANGTTVPYSIGGISAGDLSSGFLTGYFVITDGTSTININLASDNISEISENITITAGGQTISATISDPPLTYVSRAAVGEPFNSIYQNFRALASSTDGSKMFMAGGMTIAGDVYESTWNGNYFQGPVLVSYNSGETWVKSSPTTEFDLWSDICCSDSGDIVYIAGNNLHKSIDGGKTWTQIATGSIQSCCCNSNGSIVYYTTTADAFKSTNSGSSWQAIGTFPRLTLTNMWGGIQNQPIHDIKCDSTGNKLICTQGNGGNGSSNSETLLSDNGGQNWSISTTAWKTIRSSSSRDGSVLIISGATERKMSLNRGQTWSVMPSGIGTFWQAAISNDNSKIAIASRGGFYVSENGGSTFVLKSNESWVGIAANETLSKIAAIWYGGNYPEGKYMEGNNQYYYNPDRIRISNDLGTTFSEKV